MRVLRFSNAFKDVPKTAVIEIGGLLVGLLLIEWLLPGPASLASISPHPLWLPVILASVQYGYRPAVVTVAAAALVYISAGLPPKTGIEDFYTYWNRVGMLPMLWLAAALLIGQLASRRIERIVTLSTGIEIAQRERADVAAYCELVMARATEADRRLALVDHRALETTFGRLASLHDADDRVAPLAFRGAMVACLGPCTYSLYRRNGNTMERLVKYCSSQEPYAADSTATGEQLFRVVQNARKTLSVLDPNSDCPDGFALLAPIVAPDGTRIIGLLGIEAIEPNRLTPTVAPILTLVCRAVAPCVQRIVRGDKSGPQAAITSDTIVKLKNGSRSGGA